jgi:hypothetical protein
LREQLEAEGRIRVLSAEESYAIVVQFNKDLAEINRQERERKKQIQNHNIY